MLAPRVPVDARLPQLARAVDGAEMQPLFDRAVREHGELSVTGCRVDRIKYRPGRNCTVSYRLQVRDDRRARLYEEIVAGRFCGPGEAAGRHARHQRSVGLASRCGPPSLLCPEFELFAWFLPNDPKLAALPKLCEAVHGGRAAIAEAIAVLAGRTAAQPRFHGRLQQYVPETRACAVFDVHLPDRGETRLFAKLARDQRGAETHRLMQALRDSPAGRAGHLRVPQPLLWQPLTGLHWQAAVPGVPLLDIHPLCPPAIARALGRLVAALHDTPLSAPRRLGAEQLIPRARDCAATLAKVDPAWAPTLNRLLLRLEADAASVQAQPAATLHGDLHPRNILFDGEHLHLIDLDSLRCGAAVLELGAWVADSLYRAVLAGGRLADVQESAAHLLAAYRSETRQPITGPLLAWATTHALLCDRAYRTVSKLKPGWLAIVPTVLALAAMIAERGDLERPLPEL